MLTLNIGVPSSDFIVELFERDVNRSWTWVLDFIERLFLGMAATINFHRLLNQVRIRKK